MYISDGGLFDVLKLHLFTSPPLSISPSKWVSLSRFCEKISIFLIHFVSFYYRRPFLSFHNNIVVFCRTLKLCGFHWFFFWYVRNKDVPVVTSNETMWCTTFSRTNSLTNFFWKYWAHGNWDSINLLYHIISYYHIQFIFFSSCSGKKSYPQWFFQAHYSRPSLLHR